MDKVQCLGGGGGGGGERGGTVGSSGEDTWASTDNMHACKCQLFTDKGSSRLPKHLKFCFSVLATATDPSSQSSYSGLDHMDRLVYNHLVRLKRLRLTFTVNGDVINYHVTPSMGNIHSEILTFCSPRLCSTVNVFR